MIEASVKWCQTSKSSGCFYQREFNGSSLLHGTVKMMTARSIEITTSPKGILGLDLQKASICPRQHREEIENQDYIMRKLRRALESQGAG